MKNIKENERLNIVNHSCAHLLAHAIKRLYPNAKFWVGPVIEEGFYYDMDLGDKVIKEEDLIIIEKEMKKISKDGKRIIKKELSRKEALDIFKNDEYKIDLINNMDDDNIITAYAQDDFIDLCRGPHLDNVKEIKHYKLLKVSGAYFKGDPKNKMLQRIYGVCFETEEDLNNHLNFLEEAKKRDHKVLGKELDIFMMSEYSPGCPIFLKNGMIIRNELEKFWYDEHTKENYIFIKTPIMLNKELWELSGHWNSYRENMYVSEVDNKTYAIKPMNCPGGIIVYKRDLYSYRDLPLRVGELGQVHRHEASGALNGLFRVRTFTQDDAHIFMLESQIEAEVISLINFIDRIYKIFGLTYSIELSTRPLKNYIGDIKTWDKAEKALEDACLKAGHECKINPHDGAFYGPKLDFHIKDSIGRVWQCGTIQLDMNLPERFDINYIAEDGSRKRPVMLHRVIFGSMERFIGILIENFAGAFPLWLAPNQVNIIPINNEYHLEYAQEIDLLLKAKGIRSRVNSKDEKINYKIRESQTNKIPFTLVLGDKEKENKTITYRIFGTNESITINKEEFINKLIENINNKKIDYKL
ncbi:MAG: threonine--tRNA ligase [Bacilli bacterium]|nr:threonine--tRNA ligase [Bacilli bacterium]MDD4408102.1 threonine--tRNA ligase [Bacilli bacterium]